MEGLVPSPWGQFSGLWQLMSWLQSGHHVILVDFSTWGYVSVSVRQLQDVTQNVISSPWEGATGPQLCLMTTLSLSLSLSLLWLSPFVSAFSYFSDENSSLAKVSHRTSLLAQRVKRLPAVRETQVRPLGREDPLEKGKAAHSSVLAWRIPWTEEPGGLSSTR